MTPSTTTRRHGLTGVAAIAALALLGTACAPDGPDAHLAGDAAPETAPQESTDDHGDESAGEAMDDESAGEEAAAEASADSGESEDMATDTVAPTGEVVTVLALDNSFIDEVVEIEAGTEVLWTNNGRNEHDVIPVDPSQDWGVEVEDFAPGDEYSHVFGAPGEYAYYCTIHGTETVGMIGTIVVTG